MPLQLLASWTTIFYFKEILSGGNWKAMSHLIPGSKHCSPVPSENPLHRSVQSLVQPHPLPPRHSENFLAFNKFFLLFHIPSYMLVVCFSNFPIEVPGLGRFNAAAVYVWTSLPRHFQCLEDWFKVDKNIRFSWWFWCIPLPVLIVPMDLVLMDFLPCPAFPP